MTNHEKIIDAITNVKDEAILQDLLVLVSDFIYLRQTSAQSSEDNSSVQDLVS